jgi:hypothetical protein
LKYTRENIYILDKDVVGCFSYNSIESGLMATVAAKKEGTLRLLQHPGQSDEHMEALKT